MNAPPWVISPYPATVAARASLTWAPEGTLCACGKTMHVGRFDGREVARTCFRCNSCEFLTETLP